MAELERIFLINAYPENFLNLFFEVLKKYVVKDGYVSFINGILQNNFFTWRRIQRIMR